MNENDLSDLVFKNKKEWGFQNKAHTCKKCTKATPASKKILVFLSLSGNKWFVVCVKFVSSPCVRVTTLTTLNNDCIISQIVADN